MNTTITVTIRTEHVDLSAAAYLEMALEALQVGNAPRAVGCLASIDETSWRLLVDRMPGLPALVARGVR
jgi:hypothetical protein